MSSLVFPNSTNQEAPWLKSRVSMFCSMERILSGPLLLSDFDFEFCWLQLDLDIGFIG